MSTCRPIIFSAAMVRAILAGRKSQTRRVVRFPAWADPEGGLEFSGADGRPAAISRRTGCFADLPCPYGLPGDTLWVREAWAVGACADGLSPAMLHPGTWLRENGGLWFVADNTSPVHPIAPRGKTRSPIHMPRWASRITLRVVCVRAERLQEINRKDVIAEGCEPPRCPKCGYTRGDCHVHMDHSLCGAPTPPHEVTAYREMWNSIHGESAWEENPWVWRIEFEREREAA